MSTTQLSCWEVRSGCVRTNGGVLPELHHLAQAHAGRGEARIVLDGLQQAWRRLPGHGGRSVGGLIGAHETSDEEKRGGCSRCSARRGGGSRCDVVVLAHGSSTRQCSAESGGKLSAWLLSASFVKSPVGFQVCEGGNLLSVATVGYAVASIARGSGSSVGLVFCLV